MADLIFKGGKKALLEGDLNGTPDLRLALITSLSTALPTGSEEDAETLSDFTTLGEFAGAGYQRIDCENVTVTYDATDDVYYIDFDNGEFNADGLTVSPGPNDATALLVILHVDGTAANDIPIGSTDSGTFPINGSGTAITFTTPTDGLLVIGG